MKDKKLADIEKKQVKEWNPKIQDITGFDKAFTLVSATFREDDSYSDVVVEVDSKKHEVETSSSVLKDRLKKYIQEDNLGQVSISGVYLRKKKSKNGTKTYFTFASSLTE